MITSKRETKIWMFGCLALVICVATAMFLAAKGARVVSGQLRVSMAAPGQPITLETLPRVMGDVPLAPFLVPDLDATNDPALRLQAHWTLGVQREDWLLAFRSTEPYNAAASWYQRHLDGWSALDVNWGTSLRERDRQDIRGIGWTRNGDRVTLVFLPDRPGRLLLILSTPAPRKRGAGSAKRSRNPPMPRARRLDAPAPPQ